MPKQYDLRIVGEVYEIVIGSTKGDLGVAVDLVTQRGNALTLKALTRPKLLVKLLSFSTLDPYLINRLIPKEPPDRTTGSACKKCEERCETLGDTFCYECCFSLSPSLEVCAACRAVLTKGRVENARANSSDSFLCGKCHDERSGKEVTDPGWTGHARSTPTVGRINHGAWYLHIYGCDD